MNRTRYEFGEGRHGSIAVAHQLDRDSNLARFTTRFILTPLTTFLVRSELQHDRFRYSSVRDNNSFSLVPGFELKPLALISGSVLLGYKRFDAQDDTVPDYSGVVGEIDAVRVVRNSEYVRAESVRVPYAQDVWQSMNVASLRDAVDAFRRVLSDAVTMAASTDARSNASWFRPAASADSARMLCSALSASSGRETRRRCATARW